MNKKIVLGSQSPRRKELLSLMGYDFTIRTKHIDEDYPDDMELELVPVYIAKCKSEELFETLGTDELLICADTVVVLDDKILGKPKDDDEAIEMLTLLSGRSHQVITGVTLVSTEKVHSFHEITEVHFYDLSDEVIKKYVEEFSPLDKAGAYGIQEWIGHIGVKKIIGSYENVVGLPTARLYLELKEFFE